MKKSEKILAGITAAVVAGYGVSLLFGGGGAASSGASAEMVESLRDQYDARISQIQLAEDISKQYFDLVGQNAEVTEKRKEGPYRPDLDFQNEVTAWCNEFGFRNPKFEKDTEEIRDVDDYLLVSITVNIQDGDYANISKLIKRFESRGLIIQEVDLRTRLDRPEVDAEVMVGKIVENYLGNNA